MRRSLRSRSAVVAGVTEAELAIGSSWAGRISTSRQSNATNNSPAAVIRSISPPPCHDDNSPKPSRIRALGLVEPSEYVLDAPRSLDGVKEMLSRKRHWVTLALFLTHTLKRINRMSSSLTT